MQTCLLTHWTQRSEMSKRCQFCSSWNCLRHAFLLFLSSSMSNTHWRLNTCMLIIDLCMVLRAGRRSKCVLTHWQGEFFESVLPSSVFLLSPKKAHASLRNAIKEKNGISSLEAVWLLFFWGVKKKKNAGTFLQDHLTSFTAHQRVSCCRKSVSKFTRNFQACFFYKKMRRMTWNTFYSCPHSIV